MSSVTKTFTFTSSAEGWTYVAGGNGVYSWANGRLEISNSGRNKFESSGYWYINTTWQALGVPAGTTVTGVSAASFNGTVIAWDTGDYIYPYNFSVNSGTEHNFISSQPYFTYLGESRLISNENTLTGLSDSASTAVTIRLATYLDNGNSGGAVTGFALDNISLTIEYTGGPVEVVPLGITAGAPVLDSPAVSVSAADVSLEAYRWRNDDGSESTATWMADLNAAASINISSGNVAARLRFLLEELNGVSANYEVALKYQLNSGSLTEVGAASSVIRYFDSSNLTHGDDTTQQLGTGTFITDNDGVMEGDAAASALNATPYKTKAITYLASFYLDGTRLYYKAWDGNPWIHYTLATAWDIESTESYVSYYDPGYVSHSLTFKPDGTKCFFVDQTNNLIKEYTLSTAWDISTAAFSTSFSRSAISMAWGPDGTELYFLKAGWLYLYSGGTAYSLSSMSYDGAIDLTAQLGTDEGSMSFNSDGTKLIITSSRNLYEWDLSTPYDVSSRTYVGSLQLYVADYDCYCTIWNDYGLYFAAYSGETLYQYQVPTSLLAPTISFAGSDEAEIEAALEFVANDLLNGDVVKLYVGDFATPYATANITEAAGMVITFRGFGA